MERIVNLHIEKLSEVLYLAIGENADKLAFHDIDMEYVVEPGVFEIMTDPSSRDEDLQKTELTVK
jgi:hypothetical protein